jgi:plastocyanin
MNKKVISSLVLLTGIIMTIGISCSKNSSNNYNSNPPVTNDISAYNMSFSPATKTVTKGTVVTWKNNDSYPHTVTSNDGTTFNSGNIAGGGSYSYTANTAGTFEYHCTIHGLAMSGTLIVNP